MDLADEYTIWVDEHKFELIIDFFEEQKEYERLIRDAWSKYNVENDMILFDKFKEEFEYEVAEDFCEDNDDYYDYCKNQYEIAHAR